MKNEDIYQKVIERAIKNGFEYTKIADANPLPDPFTVIFSHDFAKAFWGNGVDRCSVSLQPIEQCKANSHGFHKCFNDSPDLWQVRLQQMVLEEDPIKYLEQFLLKEDSKEAQ